MRILTHGKVEIVQPFFAIMGMAVACEMAWSALFAPLSATNRHARFAFLSALVCAVAAALLYPMVLGLGLAGAALALLTANLGLAVLSGVQLAVSSTSLFATAEANRE